jgi:hypothetical protein
MCVVRYIRPRQLPFKGQERRPKYPLVSLRRDTVQNVRVIILTPEWIFCEEGNLSPLTPYLTDELVEDHRGVWVAIETAGVVKKRIEIWWHQPEGAIASPQTQNPAHS